MSAAPKSVPLTATVVSSQHKRLENFGAADTRHPFLCPALTCRPLRLWRNRAVHCAEDGPQPFLLLSPSGVRRPVIYAPYAPRPCVLYFTLAVDHRLAARSSNATPVRLPGRAVEVVRRPERHFRTSSLGFISRVHRVRVRVLPQKTIILVLKMIMLLFKLVHLGPNSIALKNRSKIRSSSIGFSTGNSQ